MDKLILKKQLPLLFGSGFMLAILASCSTQGAGGLGSATSGQTIAFSPPEKAVIAAIPAPVTAKPCQGVPASGLTWPQEFLYACHTYGGTNFTPGTAFASGFNADNVTLTSPFNCTNSYTNFAYTMAGGYSADGTNYNAAMYAASGLLDYTGNVVPAMLLDLKSSYTSVFTKLKTIYPRLRNASYKISFGGLFEIKTHSNGKKYVKLLTPIIRDFSTYNPDQTVEANPLLLGDAHSYRGITFENNPVPGPIIEMSFGLSGMTAANVPFPLAIDGDSSDGRGGQGLGAASFNLASPQIGEVMNRFVYTATLTNYDPAILITPAPVSPLSDSLSVRVDRHLCSFIVNDKFYKIKKEDFNAFAQTFNIDVTQLSVDSSGNITIALPTLYYSTQFKPRTILNNQSLSGGGPATTASTSMSPLEASEFTNAEVSAPAADETSYANLLENVEAGTTKKALPAGYTAASAP